MGAATAAVAAAVARQNVLFGAKMECDLCLIVYTPIKAPFLISANSATLLSNFNLLQPRVVTLARWQAIFCMQQHPLRAWMVVC